MKKLTENLIQQRLKTCTTDLDKVQQINVTGRELKDVTLLRKMTGVEILSLSVNQISSLADFQNCKNLRELYLRHNKISDINEIFYLKNLPKLELLMLSQNPCAEDPLYRMTVIKNLKNLTELDGVAITQDERRQAQKVGEEVLLSTDIIDRTENCILDSPQIQRTPIQNIQKLTPSVESQTEITEVKACKIIEKDIPVENTGKEGLEELILAKSPPCEIDAKSLKNVKHQTPKPKKQVPLLSTENVAMNGASCKLCGSAGRDSTHPIRIIPQNSNILSATLSLIKELDYSSLQVINAEVCSRLSAFEVNFLCNRQPFIPKGGMKEVMHI